MKSSAIPLFVSLVLFAPAPPVMAQGFGGSAAVSGGDVIVGAVYRPFDGQPWSRFGVDIAIDGDEAWIGAPGAGDFEGRYYVLSLDADGGWDTMTRFAVDGLTRNDQMGSVLALGESVGVVGLEQGDFGMGTAVIVERHAEGWTRGVKVASEVAGLDAITGDEVACEDGSADVFACANVDIVSFLPVQQIGGSRGVEVNDL